MQKKYFLTIKDGLTLLLMSLQHATDVADLVSLQNKKSVPVYAIGTSRGTISVAAIGISKPTLFSGGVLTSTVSLNPKFKSLKLIDIKMPLLFVHHELDGCSSSPTQMTKDLYDSLKSTLKVELKILNGGAEASKDPCRAKTFHGFWQVEKPVVDGIMPWFKM